MSPNKLTQPTHHPLTIRLKNDNANTNLHRVTKPAVSPLRKGPPFTMKRGKYVTRHGDRLDIVKYKNGGRLSFRIVRGLTPTDPTPPPPLDSSTDEETTTEVHEGLPYADDSDSSTDGETATDSENDSPQPQDSKQAQIEAYKKIYAIQPPQAGLQPQPEPQPQPEGKKYGVEFRVRPDSRRVVAITNNAMVVYVGRDAHTGKERGVAWLGDVERGIRSGWVCRDRERRGLGVGVDD
ncbi:hypothetical protein GE09DRAFT_1225111 [Coniochaeta sp. 2T2.1]|nr:hypothetical protein GE09DRAFT_1225111 [Coniochaeta sp. 2T2.1]